MLMLRAERTSVSWECQYRLNGRGVASMRWEERGLELVEGRKGLERMRAMLCGIRNGSCGMGKVWPGGYREQICYLWVEPCAWSWSWSWSWSW